MTVTAPTVPTAKDTFGNDANKSALSIVPQANTPVAPAGSVTTPASAPTFTADGLTGNANLYKMPDTPTTPNYGATMAAIPSVESIVDSTQTDPNSPAATTKTGLQQRILDVLGKFTGKTAAQQTAEANAGLPDLNKQLTDVGTQITALKNEANAIPLDVQGEFKGTGATEGGLQPITTGLLRQNTLKALTLSTIASTLQGNITTAQAQADRAVALEFDPLQSQIDYLKSALEFNQGDLDKEDAKQATILQAKLQERQDTLDQQKSDRQTTLGYVLKAGQAGAPANVLAQASNLDPAAALSLLQPYLRDNTIILTAIQAGAPAELIQKAKGLDDTAAATLLAPYLRDKSNYLNVAPGTTIFDPITGKAIYTAPTTAGLNGTGGPGNVSLTTTQKSDLVSISSLDSIIDQISTLGSQLGWSGVGGFASGTVQQFLAKNFGAGSADSERLRNLIGNLSATIAKERGGTSFTANEQALLNSYSPTINDSPLTIQAKIQSLKGFLEQKKGAIYTIASGQVIPSGTDELKTDPNHLSDDEFSSIVLGSSVQPTQNKGFGQSLFDAWFGKK